MNTIGFLTIGHLLIYIISTIVGLYILNLYIFIMTKTITIARLLAEKQFKEMQHGEKEKQV